MTYIIRFFSLMAFAVTLSSALSTAPCKRLLMSGLEASYIIPWIQMSGLYHLHDVPNAIFPMYKHDLQDMYFYHNATANMFQFNSAAGIIKNSYYIGAFTNRTHVVTSSITPFYPFSEMITGLFQYNPTTNDYVYHGKSTIQPMCVSDDVQTCFSGKIVFNQDLIEISAGVRYTIFSTGIHYFQSIPGLYIYLRPVYQQFDGTDNPMSRYLFYFRDHWLVGSNYTVDSGWMQSTDYSVRPEWKSGDWWLWSYDKWNYVAGLSLKCREYPMDTCSTSSTGTKCQNGGQCTSLQTSRNSLCQCAEGFTGSFCERAISRCPEYKLDVISEYDYYTNTPTEGSLLTVWCSGNYLPHYRFGVCQSNGYGQQPSWKGLESCTTTTYIRSTTYDVFAWMNEPHGRVNYDDMFSTTPVSIVERPETLIIVILVSLFGTMLSPIIICYCIDCVIKCKPHRNKKEESRVLTRFRQQMADFKLRHSEPEADYTAETRLEYETIKKEYEEESKELAERSSERKLKQRMKVSALRICSWYSYISWCIWITVLVIISAFEPLPPGSLRDCLLYTAKAFVGALPVMVFFECFFSREKKLLMKLNSLQSATTTIELHRLSQPYVGMKASCFHYETRTHMVRSSDGSMQMATYSVPVTTNTFQEEFTYGFWRDTSETNLENIRSKGVTKIKMELTINFGDHETRSAYNQQYARFHARYVNRDTHFCCRKVFQIPGFEERLLAFTDLNSKPWWIGIKYYWIASILTLTWPYRLLFNRAAGRTKYNVTKVIYQDRPADATDMSDLQLYVNLPPSIPSESGSVNDAACSILVAIIPLNPPGSDSEASSNLASTCSPSPPRPPRPPRQPPPNPRRPSNPPLPQRQPRGSNNGAASNAIEMKVLPSSSKNMVVPLQPGHNLMSKC